VPVPGSGDPAGNRPRGPTEDGPGGGEPSGEPDNAGGGDSTIEGEGDDVDGEADASDEDGPATGEEPVIVDGPGTTDGAPAEAGEAGERRSPDHDPIDWDDPDDPGHHEHDLETVSVGVVTVSSTRTLGDDPAGDAIASIVEADGHEVATRELVNDDYDGVQRAVDALVSRNDVDAVIATGGTGVTPDDVTVEAVRPLLKKELPGFGELFRSLSREEIGTRVVATRAIAGVADGVPVFCLPGSEAAARLGTESIVIPEVPHLAGLSKRPEDESDRGTSERMG